MLNRFFAVPEMPPPLPARPTVLVGDVHGRLDLLDRLIAQLSDHDLETGDIVFLGDYVDRGPDSAAVLDRLMALMQAFAGNITCLMGNHERMMLDFLDDPARAGPVWLANGGVETLAAYGIAAPPARADADRMAQHAEALRAKLRPATETWLRALPLIWRSGTLAAAHAGADPGRSLDDQDAEALLWGHRSFQKAARKDGVWLAHGHWIVPEPSARAGRIAVDTGAWRTGCLTAARVSSLGITFIQAR